MELTEAENIDLNDELLENSAEDLKSPRRGSKEELVQKILQLNEAANLELDESVTKLRRRNKQSLNKLLAECVEKSMKQKIASEIGAEPNSSEAHMNVCFLRMMHDTLCMSVEKIGTPYLQKYGYSIEGYTESLKAPQINEQLDQCLQEIALETDVLQYVQSPYARLGFLHLTCLATTIKKTRKINNAAPVESQRNFTDPSVRSSVLRRSAAGGSLTRVHFWSSKCAPSLI